MNEIGADDADTLDKKENSETNSIKEIFSKKSVESIGSHLPDIDMGFIGDVITTIGQVYFVTGSSYQGTWDVIGMTGIGRYVMPHGVIYEGEFRDGMFHGNGSLKWPQDQRIDGIWKYGKLQEFSLTFADGLTFESSNWRYCEFPDRRFHIRNNDDVQPAGRSLKTRIQPTRIVPPGCYDTGDGVFDPRTYCVTSYENPKKVLRIPKKDERDWIVENCRKAWYEPTGYRSDLVEACKEDASDEKHIPLSKESPDNWWKRITTFERDLEMSSDYEELKSRSEFGESENAVLRPKTCACHGFGKLGEPCYCIYLESSRSQSYNSEEEEYKDDLQEGQEISCDEMNEFDGENSWKLLGTVCGPRKRTRSVVRDTEIKSSTESYWSDEINIWDDSMEEEVSYEMETTIPKSKLIDEIEESKRMGAVRFEQYKEESTRGEKDIDEKIFDYMRDDENEGMEGDWREMEEEKIYIDEHEEEQESENKMFNEIMESKVKEAKEEVKGTLEKENEKDMNKDEKEEKQRKIERKSKFNEFFAIEEEHTEYEEISKTDLIEEIEEVQQMKDIEKTKVNNETKRIEEMDKIEESQMEKIEQMEYNKEIRKASEVKETEESKRTKGNELSMESQVYSTPVDKQEENLEPESEFSWQSKKEVTPVAALEEQQNWDVLSVEKIKDHKEIEKEIELHDKKFFEPEQQIFQDKLQRGKKLGRDEKESVELEEELQERMSFFKKTIPLANEETIVPDFHSPRWNIEFVKKPCDADVCMKKSSEPIHPSKKCHADRLPVNLPAKRKELRRDEHND